MNNKKKPGEAAAISGFGFQYEIFATYIYNHLLNNEIEWIEFASERSGKLDDVLIGLPDRIIAYQVKDISSSSFSYSQFTVSSTESIFEGVFKGWQKLKAEYPGHTIDARFITTQEVSEYDQIAAFSGTQKPSTKKFIKNFWTPVKGGKYSDQNLPAGWRPIFEELLEQVGASPLELISFIKDFTFVFDYQLKQVLFDPYTEAKRQGHINSIVKNIFALISKEGNTILTKTQFLARFGLKNQFETHFQHAFFVDEKHYQPITDTIAELEKITYSKSKGYIALLGNAGSGKSTLLTKWLNRGDYRILKYYAYTNLDMSYDYGYRGEAAFFLHDILVQIRENGFMEQERLPENEMTDLQQHFQQELIKLSVQGIKTFILVDGLDHIEREQKVNRSLIEVLPETRNIPDNIYFILGSRSISQLAGLSFEIRNELELSKAIVSISPLSKLQLKNLTGSYQLNLSANLFEDLYENTAGHPLFTRYTLEELKHAAEAGYHQIIESKHFSGDIYKEYQKFWDKYKEFDEFIHILGVISRFRFPYFDAGLLKHFNIKRKEALQVNAVVEFYFYKSENIWQFFHNSFKEFLIEESAKDLFNFKFDAGTDSNFHLEIAAAIENIESDYRHNRVFHLFRAGMHKEITKIISQSYFRNQWFAYRNNEIILEDINLAAQSCYKERDLKGITVCFLATFELKQRVSNFPPEKYSDLYMMVGWLDIASSFVFDKVRLLTDLGTAIDFSSLLYEQGHKVLARELFTRATPVSLLDPTRKLSLRRTNYQDYGDLNESDLVSSWAVTAALFLPISEIAEKLRGISIEQEGYDEPDSPVLPKAIIDLFYSFLEKKELDKLFELWPIAESELNKYDHFEFHFRIIQNTTTQDILYQNAIAFFDNWELSDDNDTNLQYALVYTIFEPDTNRAKSAFNFLDTPAALKAQQTYIGAISLSHYIFDYVRLFYILHKDFSVSFEPLIPLDGKPTVNGFNIAFAELGKSYAWIYHGYEDASAGYFAGINKLFGLFHFNHLDPRYDYDIASAKSQLIILILKVSGRISATMTDKLLEIIFNEWKLNKRFWSNNAIQEVIEWAIKKGSHLTWCTAVLNYLDNQIYKDGYLSKRIDNGVYQAKLWVKIGDINEAERTIDKLMVLSLDIRGEDDSQLQYLVGWIGKFEQYDDQEIQYYVDRLDSISDKVNSRTHTPAITLLELTLNQGDGFSILEYFAFKGFEDILDGLESISIYLIKQLPLARPIALRLFTRVVMALDDTHGIRHGFVHEFFQANPQINEIKNFVADVNVYAISEYREYYLYAIQKAIEELSIDPFSVGFNRKIEKSKDAGDYVNSIRLSSGESFMEEQLLPTILTVDDIRALEEKAEKHNYFDYTNLIVKVIPHATGEQLESYLSKSKFESRNATTIAVALRDSGHVVLAKTILMNSFEKTRYSGWGSIYDVNQKYIIYKTLATVENKKTVQDLAFKDFATNITKTNIGEMELVLKDLDKTAELFFENVDKDVIYEEIKAFRNELLKNHANEHQVDIKGTKNNSDLLLDVLYFLITFPGALPETVIPILLDEYDLIGEQIDALATKLFLSGYTNIYIMLLAALAKKTPSIIPGHKEYILKLIGTERFDIFLIASSLLSEAQINWERVPLTKEIPLVYTLELHAEKGLVDSGRKPVEHIDEAGLLKETRDPLALTQLFRQQINKLARLTGFSAYNIAYRIQNINADIQFPEWCSALNEEEVQRKLNLINLRIPYHRPQIQHVIAGFATVLMELYDLEMVDINDIADMMPFFDENIFFVDIVNRPLFIGTILSESGSAPSTDRKWTKILSDEYLEDTLVLKTENKVILAEKTVLSGMGHGRSIETRQSFVDVINWDQEEEYWIFPNKQKSLIEYYRYLEDGGFCIYNDVMTTEPKEQWLAINPLLAIDLGLTLNSNRGNFRWEDGLGNVVIESTFWMEGDPSNKNSHHHSETGQGWFVTITSDGYEKLLTLLEGKELYHHRKITRELNFVQKEYGTYIDEDGEKYSRAIINKNL